MPNERGVGDESWRLAPIQPVCKSSPMAGGVFAVQLDDAAVTNAKGCDETLAVPDDISVHSIVEFHDLRQTRMVERLDPQSKCVCFLVLLTP